jgi:hypothetical protein
MAAHTPTAAGTYCNPERIEIIVATAASADRSDVVGKPVKPVVFLTEDSGGRQSSGRIEVG